MRRMKAKGAETIRMFDDPFSRSTRNGTPSKHGRAPGTQTMIVKTIAFDLDGTLIESASLVGDILNSMRREK
ncbi:MAG: hypothetical protein WA733_21075, partial [Methylocystis sp.]